MSYDYSKFCAQHINAEECFITKCNILQKYFHRVMREEIKYCFQHTSLSVCFLYECRFLLRWLHAHVCKFCNKTVT